MKMENFIVPVLFPDLYCGNMMRIKRNHPGVIVEFDKLEWLIDIAPDFAMSAVNQECAGQHFRACGAGVSEAQLISNFAILRSAEPGWPEFQKYLPNPKKTSNGNDDRSTSRQQGQTASMRHMRVIVTHYGGPDALRVIEEECPEPKNGEVRVRVLAAGVALPDIMARQGIHPETPAVPYTPGWDLVGEVERLG